MERETAAARHLEALKRARDRALEKEAPPAAIRRYDAELRRVEEWVDDGAPSPHPYVPFAELDELTQRALTHWVAQTADPDPEFEALVRQASDQTEDRVARVAAMHEIADRLEKINADAAGKDATVSMELPGGLPLALPDEGMPRERQARAWRAFLATVVEKLERGLAHDDPEERQALAVVVDNPPRDADPDTWTAQRARRTIVHHGLREAMVMASEPWSGRVGSGLGSGKVTGVPADAGMVGLWKWIQQEALKFGRAELLDRAAEYSDPRRRDLRAKNLDAPDKPPLETDWPRDEAGVLLELASSGVPAEDDGPDHTVVFLAEALLVASPRERQVLLAQWNPEFASTMEDAVELVEEGLTEEDRRLLERRCDSLAEVDTALGLGKGQARQYSFRLSRKISSRTAL